MKKQYELIVIGAGPGGYTAAIRAAKLGIDTAVIECDRPGGTCLNRGCIPTKAMLHAAELAREIEKGESYGILADDPEVDTEKLLAYRAETVETLVSGVEKLLVANKVDLIHGSAELLPDKRVRVSLAQSEEGGSTEEIICADSVILASGSEPVRLPVPGIELDGVLTSDELFRLEELPRSLTIIGGGVIGVEFAEALSALGCKITIIEALPRILANMDREISQNLKLILKKRGVDIHTSASLEEICGRSPQAGEPAGLLTCRFREKDKVCEVSSEYVLCAAGRAPRTEGLVSAELAADLRTERGRIITDEYGETSITGVYAIGDIVPGIQLAHVAAAQGTIAVERIAGKSASIDLNAVPSCVYTSPEIASVGITEADAKEKEIPIKTGKFLMSANGKSLISREERGFIKILAHADTGVILGAQMMCARATDMIGELVTAVACGLTVEQLLRGMRAHPTYNEALGEALEDIDGNAVHMMPKI